MPAQAPDQTALTEEFEYNIAISDYSQIDPKWGFDDGTQRSMCGIICLKAALDHYGRRSGDDVPGARQLYEHLKSRHGWDSRIGIVHAAEVAVLEDHGLLAWRRDWERPETEPQLLPNFGGYKPDQVAAVTSQIQAESRMGDLRSRQRLAVIESIRSNNPVIASVDSKFSNNTFQHQILLIGWSNRAGFEKITVLDPEPEPGQNVYKVSVEYFFKYFKQRAIFMKPRPAA